MNAFWLRYLPKFIQDKLNSRPSLQLILSNTSWLLLDKIFRLFTGLIVGTWVARYLGPEQFGLLSYAIAFSTVFGAFASLGLESIVIREIVKSPSDEDELLNTAFSLKLIGAFIALLMSFVTITIIKSGDYLLILLVLVTTAGLIFQSFNVIDFHFQSRTQSKYSLIANNFALSITSIIKIILILAKGPLIGIALIGLLETILIALFLLTIFYKKNNRIIKPTLNPLIAKKLLNDSWPLILAAIGITIYIKVDQLMISGILSNYAVGIYTAASRLSEIWYFIPMIVANSIYPSLIREKNKDKLQLKLKKVLSYLIIVTVGIGIITSIIAERLIISLYGPAYSDSIQVLTIHIWASLFVSMGTIGNLWYLIENLQKMAFYRTLLGATANIILNIYLIPIMGVKGSAVATVISLLFCDYLFDAVNKKSRVLFNLKTNALLFR